MEFMSEMVFNKIIKERIIAIVRGIPSDQIIPLINAVNKGGISLVEVTFDQSDKKKQEETLDSIRLIKEYFDGAVCVGAGTVMTEEQVRLAVSAGAEYMISPNVDEAVIKETKRLGKLSIPGALTPTEAVFAYKQGADIVKLFPAGVLGAEYIKAVKAPLSMIPVIAVGGITPSNCRSFIEAGSVGVGCGGNLVSHKLLKEGRLNEITDIAREYTEILKEC